MRPLRLEVKGFTAFRDPVEIDFTELDVFAISGPTGSGKSSLLDAMTYALYGRVERVGDRVSQLISQGQPRMAVTLEFEVGRDRYRATRSTPGKGATKIILEHQEPGGEWRQAGEGADRVREAEPMIARAIGLTYDGFTRSVLLPQGKFSELLVGEAKKRREILTELLGLSLFKRMAERAGAIARESQVRADTMGGMLDREFAAATPEAVKDARSRAKEAVKREKALSKAAEEVLEILGRWQEAKRSLDELRSCAKQAQAMAADTLRISHELGDLSEELAEAAARVEDGAAAAKAAQQALDDAQASIREAEANLGSAEDLRNAHLWAHGLAGRLGQRSKKEAEGDAAVAFAVTLDEAAERARVLLAERREALTVQEAELQAAEATLEQAKHADLVAAVSSGLKPGDPCPVCGLPLERAPKAASPGALKVASTSVAGARKVCDAARALLAEAERGADAAARDLASNATDRQRFAAELAELDRVIEVDRKQLMVILGDPLPEDPAAEVGQRVADRERLDQAERGGAREAGGAAQALTKAEQDRDRVAAQIDRLGDRLAADHRPLLERAARAIGKKEAPPTLPAPPAAAEPGKLKEHAERTAAALTSLADRLTGAVADHATLEDRLLEEAMERVGDLVEPSPSLEPLAQAVNLACRTAAADVATASKRAQDLADRLERKKRLAEEVKVLDHRATVFRQLARELQANHLIAFLQAEALQLLAAAGSERLAGLSDGRYRLACREDEFLVVDTWNGDEERSVRTLSGGETFLASLALALALADQVRSLSVTDRARLDSLFLDEGFGTLDAETLRTVTDAIEQLGSDGRLVGVITHVRELAEQFPRIEVEKTPRGSHIRRAV